jgi:hypothetical protein
MSVNSSSSHESPVSLQKAPKTSYGLLAISAFALLFIAVVMYFAWRAFLAWGVLLSLVFVPLLLYSISAVIADLFSKYRKEHFRLPIVLRGASKGGFGLLFVSAVFALFGLFTISLAWVDASYFLLRGIVLSAFFIPLFIYAIVAIREGRSYLKVAQDGLHIHSHSQTRDLPWSEIRRFRLNPTPLLLRMDRIAGEKSFRRQAVTGQVRAVLEKGEFVLPERYGMEPVELRDLLNDVRRACLGDSEPADVPEPFGNPGELVPMIQNEDLDELRGTAKHLSERGYSGSIVPEAQLKDSERSAWISQERGGYVLCLSSGEDIEAAMLVLAEHLKSTEGKPGEQQKR